MTGRPPEVAALLAKKYGVSKRFFDRGMLYHWERMTDLGREIMVAYVKSEISSEQVRAAVQRISAEDQANNRRVSVYRANFGEKIPPQRQTIVLVEPSERVERLMRLAGAA